MWAFGEAEGAGAVAVVGRGLGWTQGGSMMSMAGWPGAGDGVAVALGVFWGCTPAGSGVGHNVGRPNQCSVKPSLAMLFLIVFPKYVFA